MYKRIECYCDVFDGYEIIVEFVQLVFGSMWMVNVWVCKDGIELFW